MNMTDSQRPDRNTTTPPTPDSTRKKELEAPQNTKDGEVEGARTNHDQDIGMDNTEKQFAFSENTHSYVRENIAAADRKAGALFTISTALLAYLFETGTTEMWLKRPATWEFIEFAAFIAMFGLAISSLFAIAVILPRTQGDGSNFRFWKSVAKYGSGMDYARSVRHASENELFEDLSRHIFDLSRVCKRKFQTLNVSLYFGAGGAVGAIFLLLFR